MVVEVNHQKQKLHSWTKIQHKEESTLVTYMVTVSYARGAINLIVTVEELIRPEVASERCSSKVIIM